MARNELKTAIYNKLAADATLTALLANGSSSIFHQIAPEQTNAPYVIFNQQSGTPDWTMGQKAFDNYTYQIKGVTEGPSAAAAGTIAARIETVLNDQPLTLASGTLLYLRKASDVDYPETNLGTIYNHSGGIYRILVM